MPPALRQPPRSFIDPGTILLTVEVVSGLTVASATMAVAATEVIKKLLEIKQQLEKEGRATAVRIGPPGSRGTPFSQADEALLRRLLGVEEQA